MMKIDKERIMKLSNGDFSEVNLNNWFKNHDFAYIFAIICGCDKNINYDMLNFVSMYALKYLEKPNAEDWLDCDYLKRLIESSGEYPLNIDSMTYEQLVNYRNKQISILCEQLLEKVIIVCSKHPEYQDIIDKLSISSNENIRLNCCVNGNYYHFLNDGSKKIRSLAKMLYIFNYEMANYDSTEIERIDFLVNALDKGVIECIDGGVNYDNPDHMFASFDSILFEHSYSVENFSKDIFYKVQDKRVLANILNLLIKDGEIVLREDMVPSCFKKDNSRHLAK